MDTYYPRYTGIIQAIQCTEDGKDWEQTEPLDRSKKVHRLNFIKNNNRPEECAECYYQVHNHGMIITAHGWTLVCPSNWLVYNPEWDYPEVMTDYDFNELYISEEEYLPRPSKEMKND